MKNKYLYKITLFLAIILLCACSNNAKRAKAGQEAKENKEFLDSYDFIRLNKTRLGLTDPRGFVVVDNKIYMVDAGENSVNIFDLDFKPIKKLEGKDMQLKKPADIDFYEDKFYIADIKDNNIKIYDKDFKLINSINLREKHDMNYGEPTYIKVNEKGIYIAYECVIKEAAFIDKYFEDGRQQIGKLFWGSLTKGGNDIFAANRGTHFEGPFMNFKHVEGFKSGKANLLKIEDNKVNELTKLEEGLMPLALCANEENIYILTSDCKINEFSKDGEFKRTLFSDSFKPKFEVEKSSNYMQIYKDRLYINFVKYNTDDESKNQAVENILVLDI